MPLFLTPHKSTLHRIAAIALYRALLTQCRAVPLTRNQRDELQHIIRNRFKQSQYVQSHRRLRVSFEAGYQAIDYLDNAVVGSQEAKEYITGLLERAPDKVKEAPPPSKAFIRATKETKAVVEESVEEQPRTSLFDRPIASKELSGNRHIPVLFSANHIPVLRIKKPQPRPLSGFLNSRIKQRQARHDRRYRLYHEQQMAKWEDEWDMLTAKRTSKSQYVDVFEGTGISDAMLRTKKVEKGLESKWTDAVDIAIVEVHGQLQEEREKNRIMAEKMQGVVDRETELFEKEQTERKRARNLERRRRKQEGVIHPQEEVQPTFEIHSIVDTISDDNGDNTSTGWRSNVKPQVAQQCQPNQNTTNHSISTSSKTCPTTRDTVSKRPTNTSASPKISVLVLDLSLHLGNRIAVSTHGPHAVQVRLPSGDAASSPVLLSKPPLVSSSGQLVTNAVDYRLGNHVLYLFIGPQRELVTLHTELLAETTRNFIYERNTGERLFQLPDENVDIFRIYRDFLYTSFVHSITDRDQDRPDNGRAQAHPDAEWTRLAQCYVLAVTIKDERFANACTDAIIEKMAETDRYPTGIASEVYQFTSVGDPLRKLIVDVHIWKGKGTWVHLPHEDASGPREFLQDIISGLARAGGAIYDGEVDMPWEQSACGYHSHRVTEVCGR